MYFYPCKHINIENTTYPIFSYINRELEVQTIVGLISTAGDQQPNVLDILIYAELKQSCMLSL